MPTSLCVTPVDYNEEEDTAPSVPTSSETFCADKSINQEGGEGISFQLVSVATVGIRGRERS